MISQLMSQNLATNFLKLVHLAILNFATKLTNKSIVKFVGNQTRFMNYSHVFEANQSNSITATTNI
jgi:hypothetical protein